MAALDTKQSIRNAGERTRSVGGIDAQRPSRTFELPHQLARITYRYKYYIHEGLSVKVRFVVIDVVVAIASSNLILTHLPKLDLSA